ncbi:MAG: FHA domain-containing protein [Anaerolineae bacterium]|nr:FHA domain-containing protein [Anaerolineae bacterium]
MSFPIKYRILAFCLAASLCFAAMAYAQDSTGTLINYPEVIDEGADDLLLRLYFTLVDAEGRAVADADIESASVLLETGASYPVAVEHPDTPFYIALVLDASGSMSRTAEDMRRAAIQAINDAPAAARFAVLRFNEDIDLLQDFTETPGLAVAAIDEVVPINLKGTCLYDAAYEAVTRLGAAPQGRRAVILFTDGRDELASGDPCSTHTRDDVIDLATRYEARVPVHTIGLGEVDEDELREIARATGGLSAIGGRANLNDLFAQIMNALKSQWVAYTPICIPQGQHQATLNLVLSGGAAASGDVVSFETLRTCIPVALAVDAAEVDWETETVRLALEIAGEEKIAQYRVRFENVRSGLRQGEFFIAAPLPGGGQMELPAATLNDKDQIRIDIVALDAEDKPLAAADHTVTINRPVVAAVEIALNAVEYHEDKGAIRLDLSLLAPEQIAVLQVNITDAETGSRIVAYTLDPARDIELPDDQLEAGGRYLIEVIAQDAAGSNLGQSSRSLNIKARAPENTPLVRIESVKSDREAEMLTIQIYTENAQAVERYELTLVDSQTQITVPDFPRTVVPAGGLVPLSRAGIGAGEYDLTISAITERAVVATHTLQIAIDPPLSFLERAARSPITIAALAVLLVALAGLILWLRRRPDDRTAPAPDPLAERTYFAPAPTPTPTPAPAQPGAPRATLTAQETQDAAARGQTFAVTHLPCRLGRLGKEINFDGDGNVSRHHATLTLDAGVFYLADAGSTRGTTVNGERLTPNKPVRLNDGAIIVLGESTRLRFNTGAHLDKTFAADEPPGGGG